MSNRFFLWSLVFAFVVSILLHNYLIMLLGWGMVYSNYEKAKSNKKILKEAKKLNLKIGYVELKK